MLYQRGNIWWMKFRVAGRLYRESTHTDSKPLARKIARKRQRDLEAARHGIVKRVAPVTLSKAAADWLGMKEATLAAKSYDIEKRNVNSHLKPVFGPRLLIDINAESIADHQRAQLRKGAAPKTVNLELGTLRAILRRHRLWSELQPDVKMLPVLEVIGDVLKPEEEKGLLDACQESRSRLLLPAVTLAIHTGMRKGEIRNLRWSQVDFLAEKLTVGKAKTAAGTGRTVVLNAQALATLKDWATTFPKRQPHHYVCPSEHYGLAGNDRVRQASTTDPTKPAGDISSGWESARKRANVTLRFHDLRHTFVSRLLEQGVGLSVVGSIVGWSASTLAKMAKRYGHISADAQRAAVTRLVGFGRATEEPTEAETEAHSEESAAGLPSNDQGTDSTGSHTASDVRRGTN